MKTLSSIRKEFYDILKDDTVISGLVPGVYAYGNMSAAAFPCITYSRVLASADYSFGIIHQVDTVVFQADVWVDTGEIDLSDGIFEAIRNAMHSNNWRMISAPTEWVDDKTKKIVTSLRFEKLNV